MALKKIKALILEQDTMGDYETPKEQCCVYKKCKPALGF